MSGVDAFVQGPQDSDGKKIDNDVLTIGLNQVYRQRTRLAGAAAGELADVRNADPAGGDYGMVARLAGTVPLPTGASTEATLALIKTDVDKLPADPAREGGNLATVATNTTGVAKDATLVTLDADLKAEIGTLESRPAAYTVLDRLSQMQRDVAAQAATMKQVLVALSKPPAPRATSTLMHRS